MSQSGIAGGSTATGGPRLPSAEDLDRWAGRPGPGVAVSAISKTCGAPVAAPAARLPWEQRPVVSKFEEDVRSIFHEFAELLLKKHGDYGPKNIANSPGGPLNGIRVRLYDKTARIDNLLDNNLQAQNEPLEDAFVDSAVYNAIAVLVMRRQWPA